MTIGIYKITNSINGKGYRSISKKMKDIWDDPDYHVRVLEKRRLANLKPETKLKRSITPIRKE